MSRPKRKLIGYVGTDTAKLVIVDPCQADKVPETNNDTLYEPEYSILGNETAAQVTTDCSDGAYPVYVEVVQYPGERDRVVGVYVDFITKEERRELNHRAVLS